MFQHTHFLLKKKRDSVFAFYKNLMVTWNFFRTYSLIAVKFAPGFPRAKELVCTRSILMMIIRIAL
jgi:hypothetical protein